MRDAPVSVTHAAMAPDTGPAEWTFPADPGSVRTARAVVGETLRAWHLDESSDLAVLLVSELVTNALRYAPGPIGVRLTPLPDGSAPVLLRVEVSDPVPDPPQVRTAGVDDEGGRGLQLVAATASNWGASGNSAGKSVWFELSLPG